MKRLLLAAAFGLAGLLASAPAAQAQRTDTTYVKPQLPTGPPMAPPSTQPTRPTTTQPAPVSPQPQQPQQPVRPSTGIDDDGRTAQPLLGSSTVPAAPAPKSPTSVGRGIDDDGRPAQTLPQNGTVPGATLQSEYKPSKYFLYGNLSLGLSSNAFNGVRYNIGASPALGYRINSRLAIGPGLVYSHSGYTIPSQYQGNGIPGSISANNLGVKVFGQFIVYKQFFLHAEYEVTRAETIQELLFYNSAGYLVSVEPVKLRATVRTPLLGAGYRQQFGDKFAGDIAILYNFNNGLDMNIYGQPVIRFSLLYDLGK